MDIELKGIGKEAVIEEFEILSRHFFKRQKLKDTYICRL